MMTAVTMVPATVPIATIASTLSSFFAGSTTSLLSKWSDVTFGCSRDASFPAEFRTCPVLLMWKKLTDPLQRSSPEQGGRRDAVFPAIAGLTGVVVTAASFSQGLTGVLGMESFSSLGMILGTSPVIGHWELGR